MLAKRRGLFLDGIEVARTPLLVPSFSSKGFPEVDKIIQTTSDVIDAAILVSAYDLCHGIINPPFGFASLIFLDSGGFEASKDTEIPDLGIRDHKTNEWDRELHEKTLASWHNRVPTVIVSYDHPEEREPVDVQIERAKNMAPGRKGVLREILLKPEKRSNKFLQIKSVLPHIHNLAGFDAVGITADEMGPSIQKRMEAIADFRSALGNAGLDMPIHIFGSLDAVSAPLFFVVGADIFDGLTWLRYAFKDGLPVYIKNFGTIEYGVQTRDDMIAPHSWSSNYRYLKELEAQMRRFLNNHNFACFDHHSRLIKKIYESVIETMEEK